MTRHNGKSGLEMSQMLNKLDLVEVVRCKDCKHKDTDKCPMADTSYCEWVTWSNPDDYCSRGERKESEEC